MLLLGILILGTVMAIGFHRVEIEKFIALAQASRPEWLLFGCVAQAGTYFCTGAVWYRTLQHAGSRRSLLSLVPLGIAKLFTDQAMPSGGVSGTMLVVGGLARRRVAADASIVTLLLSLVSYYSAYLLVVLISVGILWFNHQANPTLVIITLIFSVVAIGMTAGALWLPHSKWLPTLTFLQRFPHLMTLLEASRRAPMEMLQNPRLLAETTAWQISVFLLDALTLWLVFEAIGQPTAFWVVFVSFVSASVVATLGPIPLGLGTFEASSVGMLSLLGVEVEAALTATILLRGLTFWIPMLPGLWLAKREITPLQDKAR